MMNDMETYGLKARRKTTSPAAKRKRMRSVALWIIMLQPVSIPTALSTPKEWTPAQADQIFYKAGALYDEGELDQAIETYNELVDHDYISAALFFNLGNCHFKKGALGEAILHYRRASYLDPRDAEITANLNFAIENAGGLQPAKTIWNLLARQCGLRGWIRIATGSYWLIAIAMGVYLWFTRKRKIVLRIAGAAGTVWILSMIAVSAWSSTLKRPEIVILKGPTQALYAPIEGSTAHFEIPEGSILRLDERSESWLKVRSGKQSGWIPNTVCDTVYPWR